MRKIKECKTHTSTYEAKEKEEHEICLEFCGTTSVIFKSTVSDSNEVGLTPKLGNFIPCLGLFNVLSAYEYWLCKT
jgi:hypothetical protein